MGFIILLAIHGFLAIFQTMFFCAQFRSRTSSPAKDPLKLVAIGDGPSHQLLGLFRSHFVSP